MSTWIESDTVIIGASAAGLGVAACLARAGAPFVMLEQAPHVAPTWRRHYERLHLHSSKGLSGLPYLAFPRGTPRYPSRDQVVAYLEAYAARLGLAPRFGQRVVTLQREDDRWVTRTPDACYRSARVVIATGLARVPRKPGWPGLESFGGPVIHSSAYREAAAFRGKSVLVVGIGNSGAEIALDLAEHGARPGIAVRSRVNVVPRDFLGLPILAWGIALDLLPARLGDAIARLVGRITLGRWERLGLAPLPYGPITQIRRHGRVPLLDIGTIARIRRGDIAVHPDVESLSPGHVRFHDGTEHPSTPSCSRPATGPPSPRSSIPRSPPRPGSTTMAPPRAAAPRSSQASSAAASTSARRACSARSTARPAGSRAPSRSARGCNERRLFPHPITRSA
jgi:indole-3-pyruvate monooxygenase